MALLDGLRGGQALLNMANFGPGIQVPDDSRMYAMAMAGGTSGGTTGKGNQGKEKAPKYLTGASKEYMLKQQAIENAKVEMGNMLYKDYKDSGKSFTAWQRANGDKIVKAMNILNEQEIALMSVQNKEEKNVKLYNTITQDSEAARDIAFVGGQNTIGVEIYTSAKDKDGKPKMVKENKVLNAEEFPQIKNLQLKVLNNTPLSKKETEKAESLLGENYFTILSSSTIKPTTLHNYAYLQDETKPLGEEFDPGGYIPPSAKKIADERATSLVQKASEQMMQWSGIDGTGREYIAEGYGGVRNKHISSSSAQSIENQVMNYYETLSDNDKQYWKNEWLKAVDQNEIGIKYKYEKGKGDKVELTQLRTPVAEMNLEEYVKSAIMMRAQPKITNDITEQIYRKSETKQAKEEELKTNWYYQMINRNLPPESVGSGGDPFGNINYDGPLKGIFDSYKNVILNNAKNRGADINNQEIIQGANKLAIDQIKKDIISRKIVKNKSFMNKIGDVAMELVMNNPTSIAARQLNKAKTQDELLDAVNNLIGSTEELYKSFRYKIPENEVYSNNLSQTKNFRNPNETIVLGGKEIQVSKLGNMRIKMSNDHELFITENFQTQKRYEEGKPEKRIITGTYEIYPGTEDGKIDVDDVKENLIKAGVSPILVDGMTIQSGWKTIKTENNKKTTVPVVFVQGYEDFEDIDLVNAARYGESPKAFYGNEPQGANLSTLPGAQAAE